MIFFIKQTKFSFIFFIFYLTLAITNASKHNNSSKSITFLRDYKKLMTFDPNYLGLDPYKQTLLLGYPAENHVIQTEDNYLLTLLRIPRGRNNTDKNESRPIVFMVPPLYFSAAAFTDLGPDAALAYLLVDEGYDVWIINHRGTTFSRKHLFYDPVKVKRYWNFSWHELAVFDLTSSIDYINNVTGQSHLSMITYSQSTTTALVLLSERPEYNEKIKVGFLLGPVAYLDKFPDRCLIKPLLEAAESLEELNTVLGMYGIFPHTAAVAEPVMETCNVNSTQSQLARCKNLIDLIAGDPFNQVDPRNVEIIANHFPGGGSAHQLIHYNQVLQTGHFAKYDHGRLLNKKMYGQEEPPLYNLTNIQAPLVLMYCDNDIYATPENVKKLHQQLSNSKLFRIDSPTFTHLDFLHSNVSYNLVTVHIIDILNKYNTKYLFRNLLLFP